MTIEERLEALEKEARRSRKIVRWLSALFILCVAAWIATSVFLPQGMIVARDVADEIRTRKLVVVDEMGRDGIVIDANRLAIYDKEGNSRIVANLLNRSVPFLSIYDETGNPRIYMGIGKDGVPTLGITNAQQVRQIEMKALEYTPYIGVYDVDGDMRVSIGLTYGIPELNMYDKRKKLRITLSSSLIGPVMSMLGEDENPSIFMFLSDQRGAAGLEIYDKQGDIIWSTP